MAAATATHEAPHEDPQHGSAGHDHPSDGRYWVIALILGVTTAIEVYLSYAHWMGNAAAPLLLVGMVIKFFLVASFFMHLKFDSKVLRRLLISGLFLAVGCYVGVLFMFRQFDKGSRAESCYETSSLTAPACAGDPAVRTTP